MYNYLPGKEHGLLRYSMLLDVLCRVPAAHTHVAMIEFCLPCCDRTDGESGRGKFYPPPPEGHSVSNPAPNLRTAPLSLPADQLTFTPHRSRALNSTAVSKRVICMRIQDRGILACNMTQSPLAGYKGAVSSSRHLFQQVSHHPPLSQSTQPNFLSTLPYLILESG